MKTMWWCVPTGLVLVGLGLGCQSESGGSNLSGFAAGGRLAASPVSGTGVPASVLPPVGAVAGQSAALGAAGMVAVSSGVSSGAAGTSSSAAAGTNSSSSGVAGMSASGGAGAAGTAAGAAAGASGAGGSAAGAGKGAGGGSATAGSGSASPGTEAFAGMMTAAGSCSGATPHGCFTPKTENAMTCPKQIPEQSAEYPPMNEWKSCPSNGLKCVYDIPGGATANCSCDLTVHWLCDYPECAGAGNYMNPQPLATCKRP